MWQLIVFPRKETSYNTSISCGLNDWASVHFWDSLGRCERTTDMFLKHTFEYGILSPGQQICSLHPCVCPCITLKNIYYSSIVALQCVSLFCTAKWISYEYACMLICFSHFQLCESLWTVACQASLSMRFSRQEYWSGLPCPPPGNLPNPGIELASLLSPALAGKFSTTSTTWVAHRKTSKYWGAKDGL